MQCYPSDTYCVISIYLFLLVYKFYCNVQSLLKRDLNYWKIAWYKLKQEQGERDQWSIKSDNLIEIPPKKMKNCTWPKSQATGFDFKQGQQIKEDYITPCLWISTRPNLESIPRTVFHARGVYFAFYSYMHMVKW